MKTLILKSILAIALCGFVCAETVQDTKVPYKLGVFDIITIDVTGTPTEAPIALFCAIEPDGHVQLGSGYGSVRIAGLTAEEAQEAIIKHLTGTAYMLSNVPAVTVRLQRMYVEQRIAGMPHPPMPMPYGLHLPALHFQPPQPVFSPPYAVPQPYMVPQQDDGYMNLGTYGLVYVKGLTDDEVRKAIEFHLAGYWERATAKVNAQVEDFLVQRRAPQESTRSRVARSGITIQQPSTGTFHISTTVTAPDSGKVLGGSLRRFSEGQVEATQGETLAQLSAMQAPQQQRPERERQIMRQLDMPVTVDIDLSFSLEKAVNMLCEQIDIVPHIDQAALRESGYRTDLLDNTHIIRANAMKARSVLNAILEPHGLAWVVNNGRLTITTKKHAREMKLERWYFVGDLDHDPMMFSGIFMSVIEPDSWMQGDVYIDVHATTQSLVVRQTETVHAQIEDLLGQIRNLRDGKHPVPQTAYSLPLQSSIAQQQRPESERWILQQLERPLVVTRDTLLPLDENLEMLAKICNDTSIPYYLDVAALREAGVQPNVLVSTPQTINLSLIDDARP
ncbi:MAG: polysaccharide biosynthesis/export family protein, partial [Planctomycetaceae bacterium]|nr:polysaccharide biosynthesis/export family protein [Planctomycetaceae bacterium]